VSEPAPEVQNDDTDETVRLLQPAIILARSIETFCQTFGKAMVINDAVPSLSTPSTASVSTVDDGDATPNGLAMNLPILHDISCISYKDYKGSK